ncbi:glycoside hydrolase family 26 protein [Streptomyces triticiradicis]|uniref:Beta-mannanase n=1 Tax=Streptomyces triticiradicis TaxID=2651189 RepID=A0A7J5DFR8_9ACTN|nr:glycosyl hydrolase [Streptomyces triticiradicis]KAB1987720.1 beta-mannanase [Streptomyces triticiradicis]
MAIARRRSRLTAAAILMAAVTFLVNACGAGGGSDAGAGTTTTPAAHFEVSSMLEPSGRALGVVDDKTPWQYGIVTTFTEEAGRAPDIREYYSSWGGDFDAEGNAFLWKHGHLPMMALVPSDTPLADIAEGGDDTYIRRLADQIASYDGPLALSFAGEMNGPWNSWGPEHAEPADFVAAWKHVHDVFEERGVTNVIWVWTPHVVDSGTPAKLRPYYPGDAYVDWVGLIGYYGPIDGVAFSSLFTPTMRQIAGFSDKPVLIAETGVAQSDQKQAHIRDLFRGAAKAGVIGVVWYDQRKDWPGGKQLMDWRIKTSVGALAAFQVESARNGFGHSFKND